MKIFSSEKIRKIDEMTIISDSISSIDLMEKASHCFFNKFCSFFTNNCPVYVICGPGNNGGDALAVARMLLNSDYKVTVLLFRGNSISNDCLVNKNRLNKLHPNAITEFYDSFSTPQNLDNNAILIDGLFGTGLSRPLSGIYSDVVEWMNSIENTVVSIDIPSGMFSELPLTTNHQIVKSDYTFTFQFPKINFLLPEFGQNVGKWYILDIGLSKTAITESETNYFFTDKDNIKSILLNRSKFSHKGTYGHVLILAGSKGMAGASVLTTKAVLRSGAGLVTIHGPECNRIVLQTAVPEAIFSADKNNTDFIQSYPEIKNFKTIGIGCGIGNSSETASMIEKLFTELFSPCVVDADALNIISRNKHLLDLLPEKSIITPHPKEFDRLFGNSESTIKRIEKAIEMAKRYKIIIVLKGAYTAIITHDGKCIFNSTGNSGLATAGSGDVLTGIITGLLSQDYSPENAAILGVYLHGLSADLLLSNQSEESLIASDIVGMLGKAFNSIKST